MGDPRAPFRHPPLSLHSYTGYIGCLSRAIRDLGGGGEGAVRLSLSFVELNSFTGKIPPQPTDGFPLASVPSVIIY